MGDSATIRWSTSSATTCTASAAPAGSLEGWNINTVIESVDSGSKSVLFSAAGVYNLYLNCEGDNGSQDSAIITARVGSATINSFTVTPTAANTGDNVTLTLTWSASNASLGCFGSDNWPFSTELSSSGSRSVDVTNIQPGTSYTLTCVGAFDEDVQSVFVKVTDVVATCDVSLNNGITRDWASVFKATWPAPPQTQIRVTVPNRGYYAVKFNSGDVIDAGVLSTIEASGTSGTRKGSLSEIPGCFDVAPECTHTWGRSGSIVWDTTGTDGRCQLKPDTDYYYNMTFTDGATTDSASCIGFYCETILFVINPD